MSELKNWVMTSNSAPWVEAGIAMPWAQLGTSVPFLLESWNSAFESLAHWSNFAIGTPARAGIEPLFKLKVSWNGTLMMASASACWPALAPALFCSNITKLSMLKV